MAYVHNMYEKYKGIINVILGAISFALLLLSPIPDYISLWGSLQNRTIVASVFPVTPLISVRNDVLSDIQIYYKSEVIDSLFLVQAQIKY